MRSSSSYFPNLVVSADDNVGVPQGRGRYHVTRRKLDVLAVGVRVGAGPGVWCCPGCALSCSLGCCSLRLRGQARRCCSFLPWVLQVRSRSPGGCSSTRLPGGARP